MLHVCVHVFHRYIFYISLSNCVEENGSTYRCASLSVDFSFVVLQEKIVAANHIIFILFLAKVYSVKVHKNFNFKKRNINKMAQLMLRQTRLCIGLQRSTEVNMLTSWTWPYWHVVHYSVRQEANV